MSLIPKAIELAFELLATRTLANGAPRVEHALHVWERFRKHRPLGETPLRRYEELGCVALLHEVVGEQMISEERVAALFNPFVAAAVGRVGSPDSPRDGDDLDLQLIMVIARLELLAFDREAYTPGELSRRVDELAQRCLPLVDVRHPDLARDIRFLLKDFQSERAVGMASPLT